MSVKVTFLGTGTSQGVPLVACECEVCVSNDLKDKRLRSSIMLEVDDKLFVVDSGPDFRQQMLREKVKRLDGVIFTHEHKDHIAGLDDVKAFNFILKKEIDVYVSPNVLIALKREYHYIFNNSNYPGIPRINVKHIENKPFSASGVCIIPIEVMHYKLPVLGFRIGDFTYITDANHISDKEKKKIIGSKVLVLNALRKESHISHFSLEEAIALIKEINPEKAYLVHVSHQLGLHADVSKLLPENIELAYDGLKITVG